VVARCGIVTGTRSDAPVHCNRGCAQRVRAHSDATGETRLAHPAAPRSRAVRPMGSDHCRLVGRGRRALARGRVIRSWRSLGLPRARRSVP
jgi:hypothetical protein